MKIAIFGLARSGMAAMRYLLTKNNVEIFLINQGRPSSWNAWQEINGLSQTHKISIDHCFDQEEAAGILAEMDQIILSPGIPREHKSLVQAITAGVPVISEIEFAYINSDIPVIAITGTNGKTTTATMVAQVLERAGLKVFLGGNIGRPYCEIFDDFYDYAVIEVSSFQLESIETFRPKIAMILNITPNHTERYETFEEYAQAKYNIFKNMRVDDHALIDVDLDTASITAQLHYIKALEEFDFSKSHLVGSHNKENFYCAWKVLELLKVDNAQSVMQEFINHFPGVKYRLQYVGNYQGLKIYNDAKSTNNAATESAVRAFQDENCNLYLILGGKLRSDKVDIVESIRGLKIQEIFVMGEARTLLQKNLEYEFKVQSFEGLADIFEMLAVKKLQGNLLFSPAFPSFDQYKDYEHRGEDFTQRAKNLIE